MQKNQTDPTIAARHGAIVKHRKEYCPIADFPLGVVTCIQHGMMDIHTHDSFSELVLITEGYGVHCIGSQSYNIKSGDVFVVRGDVPHYYRDGYGLSLINIIFNWEELHIPSLDIGEIVPYQTLFVIDPSNTDSKRFDQRFRLGSKDFNCILTKIRILDELLHYSPRPAGIRFRAVTIFLEILNMIFNTYDQQSGENRIAQPRHQLGELAAMLERNYASPITVQKMCRKAGMSYASLFRQFRQFYHDSPINYLIRQRLTHAADMLRADPETAVGEIAYQCGFTDSAYFSRKFKEYYKVPPSDYRKGQM